MTSALVPSQIVHNTFLLCVLYSTVRFGAALYIRASRKPDTGSSGGRESWNHPTVVAADGDGARRPYYSGSIQSGMVCVTPLSASLGIAKHDACCLALFRARMCQSYPAARRTVREDRNSD
eukprot:TRINITY_DN12275_c0_g1_i1.p2 TRINITY_DN12275_c0_g1~~TRINITY_DN12275_c0_g1_i1.p2  ORF type:complete len:121 (-),score=3.38 TRINITY_DN12275_c0_g1_i1:66-428(-)